MVRCRGAIIKLKPLRIMIYQKSKIICLCVVALINYVAIGQNDFESWNRNYPVKNPNQILQTEIDYALKTKKNKEEAQYYVSSNKFRFHAKFTGNKRIISNNTLQFMANVVALKFGKKIYNSSSGKF